MKHLLVACALILAGASVSQAQPYGLAGCGLGTMVFGKQDKYSKIQIVAGTLNATGTQTFGITTGTSNCVDRQDTWASLYIETNYETLKNDIARGEGETIHSLAKIYNCQDVGAFSTNLKSNYSTLFESNNPVETKNQVRSIASDLNCNFKS